MIKLVLSDLDATLLDTPRSGLTGRAAAAIRAAMARGVVFGPCTGRSPAFLPGLFGPDREDLYRSGVFDNGMVAYLDGERVHARSYDPAALADLALRVRREGIGELGVCGLPDRPAEFVVVDEAWLAATGKAPSPASPRRTSTCPRGPTSCRPPGISAPCTRTSTS